MNVSFGGGWKRYALGFGLCAAVLAALADCSSERGPKEESQALVPPEGARLAAITSRFAGTFGEVRDGFAHAAVELGDTVGSAVIIRDVHSAVAVSFQLLGVGDADLVQVDDMHIAPGPLGSDLIMRVSPQGVEDFFYFASAPAEQQLRYTLDVSELAGMRLLSNSLELLDKDGAPRLRVAPPYIVDAAGIRHHASLSIDDCAYDSSAAAPWERPVVAPGSDSCTLTVGWAADITYPALLDPVWESTSNAMVSARRLHTATELSPGTTDSILVIAGGFSGTAAVDLCELYHPATRTFARTGDLITARGEHAAASLRSSTSAPEGEPVVVVGGRTTASGTNIGSGALEVYNPTTGQFAASSSNPLPRRNQTATLFADDLVLFAGGRGAAPLATAEIYTFSTFINGGTTSTGTVAPTVTPMGEARSHHTATLLGPSGKVLIAAGLKSNFAVKSAELYNPATSSFEAIVVAGGGFQVDMGVPRMRHTATLVPQAIPTDILVLITGGTNGSADAQFQDRLDVYTQTSTTSGFLTQGQPATMLSPRADHGATLMGDNSVVVTGGRSAIGTVEASAEAITYNPATAQFGVVALAPMSVARYGHVAVSVNAGATNTAGRGVLVAGGADTNGDHDTAQVLVAKNGESCTDDQACESGNCSAGICCTETCAEACKSCDGAISGGTTGICTSLPNGALLAPVCIDEVVVTNQCDGAGNVAVSEAKDCRPQVCNGDNTACSTFCLVNSDCSEFAWCNLDASGTGGAGGGGGAGGAAPGTTGKCQDLKAFGVSCTSEEECTVPVGSEVPFCIDGVCCNSACTGQCEACNVSPPGECGNVGTLTPEPPAASKPVCNGAGTVCAGVCNGLNSEACFYDAGAEPTDSTCACTETGCAESHTICNDNGGIDASATGATVDCNGHLCADDRVCATGCETNAECVGDFVCDDGTCRALAGPECDGAQTLFQLGAGTDVDCAPYACPTGNTSCLDECASVDDCGTDAVCDGQGQCIAQITGPDVPSCACDVPGGQPSRTVSWLWLAAALIPLRRRRRPLALVK